MDDALVRCRKAPRRDRGHVLILVVMDDALVQAARSAMKMSGMSLNPCCNG